MDYKDELIEEIYANLKGFCPIVNDYCSNDDDYDCCLCDDYNEYVNSFQLNKKDNQ